jgi:DNA-binding IclR family transcriptional regulator
VRPELDALVDELGMEALASVVSSGEIVVVAHARTGGFLSSTVRMGQTIPFVPPFGIAHLVHAPAAELDAWLDRSRIPLTPAQRDEYRAVIALAERRGYVVVLDMESRRRFEQTVAELAERPGSVTARRRRDALVDAIARDELAALALGPRAGSETAEVSQISAPVLGPDGRAVVAIGIHGLPHQIEATRLTDHAKRVLAAADRVTDRLRGRPTG